GEDDVRAVVGAVGVLAVPAAREVHDAQHLAAARAERVLAGADPVGEAGAGPAGAGVGRAVGGGLGVTGDDPQEARHRHDTGTRVAAELQGHRPRTEHLADVAVRVVLVVVDRAVAQDRPEVRGLVAQTARGVRGLQALVGREGVCRQVAHVVVQVVCSIAHSGSDDEVVRVEVALAVGAAARHERAARAAAAGAGVGPAAADLPDVHEVGDERADVVAVRRLAAGGRGRRGRLPGVVPAAARVAEAVPEAVAVAVPVAEAVPVLVAPAEGLGRGLGGGVRCADEGAALVLALLTLLVLLVLLGPLLLVLAPVALVLPGPLVLVLLVVPLTLVTGVAV